MTDDLLTQLEISKVKYRTHRRLESGELDYHPDVFYHEMCKAQRDKCHGLIDWNPAKADEHPK